MAKYVVIKDILNVRNKPSVGDESIIGSLKLGEEVELTDDVIEGEIPAGTDDNRWHADSLNRFVSKPGVAKLGTYAAKKAAFLMDEFNKPFYDESDKENEEKWKISWGHVDLEIWRIWKKYGTKGKGVKVVVIDDGCWHTENDLKGRLSLQSKCIVGNDFQELNPDHGTHSAGIIGSSGDTTYGIAPECELIVFKAGADLAFDPFDIANALREARILEPDIISLSLSAFDDASIKNEVDACVAKEGKPILILAAAGNKSSDLKRYPASYDGVFSVGAYLKNNSADREIYKERSNPQASIKFLAPGKDILSTGRQKERSFYDDTSAATAFASGIIALIVAVCKDKEISFASLLHALEMESCCEKIEPDVQNNPFEGFGVLSPLNLINFFLT